MFANIKGFGETALIRGLPEPFKIAYVIGTLSSCTGSVLEFIQDLSYIDGRKTIQGMNNARAIA